ncbi:MAG: ABC transporter permease, partial [Fusobacteriaceae bacterium]
MTQEISYISLFYFCLTVIPIFLIMKHLKIELIKKTWTALGRMAGQLILVGVYLQYIFSWNNFMINIGYITLMTLVAVWTISGEIKFKETKLYIILFVGMIVPVIINLIFFNVLILKLKNVFDAMYLIPITGMILGNSMNGSIVALGDFIKSFRKNQDEYLFTLGLGATKTEAVRPYIASSISLSLKPNIAMMANVGVVSLPGMMTGQILGGSLPILAIKYQIAIMLAIFTARFFSTYIIMELISKFYFDKFSILDKR